MYNSSGRLQPGALERSDIPDAERKVRKHVQRFWEILEVSIFAKAVHRDMKAGLGSVGKRGGGRFGLWIF